MQYLYRLVIYFFNRRNIAKSSRTCVHEELSLLRVRFQLCDSVRRYTQHASRASSAHYEVPNIASLRALGNKISKYNAVTVHMSRLDTPPLSLHSTNLCTTSLSNSLSSVHQPCPQPVVSVVHRSRHRRCRPPAVYPSRI